MKFIIFFVVGVLVLCFLISWIFGMKRKKEREEARIIAEHRFKAERYRRDQEEIERKKSEQIVKERSQEYNKKIESVENRQEMLKEFSYDEAVDIYIKTNHKSCKSIYDYHTYFREAFACILKGLNSYNIVLSNEKVLRQKEIDNPIDDSKNFTKATKRSKIENFIVIDTETTGLKCGGNDIIEICAIKFIGFRPVEKFHTYLKPRNPIPASATEINHITDDMVKDAPVFSQIKSSLQNFIGDYPIVAHNAPFDVKFLHVSGLNFEKHVDKVYDTLKLAKLKLRDYDGSKFESYKLSDLCIEQNISCSNFHSADADALACGILFIDIIKSVKEIENIDDFI